MTGSVGDVYTGGDLLTLSFLDRFWISDQIVTRINFDDNEFHLTPDNCQNYQIFVEIF